jgi:uncharacterized protein YqgC (DUF456 family)
MAILALVAIILLSLIMIPFGLPGTLVMLCGAIGYKVLVPVGGISWFTVGVLAALMILAEGLEWVLTARFTKKYGGSRRATWGAIIGGMIGAFMGVPVPVVGSVIGAFVGAFVGAFAFEFSRAADHGAATRVAWGAFIGRVVAAAMKVGIGLVMGVWLLFAALA